MIKCSARKSYRICLLPEVFQITLKRTDNARRKILTKIKIPLKISFYEQLDEDVQNVFYDLICVIIHIGDTMKSGHVTSK